MRLIPLFEPDSHSKEVLIDLGFDVGLAPEKPTIQSIIANLKSENKEDWILFMDTDSVHPLVAPVSLKESVKKEDIDVIFAAQSGFECDDRELAYYFWKYYPRVSSSYHFINSNAFLGKGKSLLQLFEFVVASYPTAHQFTFRDLISLVYLDQQLDVITPEIELQVDHDQSIFGGGTGEFRILNWPMISWIQDTFYRRLEAKMIGNQEVKWKPVPKHLSFKSTGHYNRKTKTSPGLIHIPIPFTQHIKVESKRGLISSIRSSGKPLLGSGVLWIQSFFMFLAAWTINRTETRPGRLFRYTRNLNPQFWETIEGFISKLRNGEPFTFSHFNDGEVTFVKKYLAENHKETWFGRRQQKYNKKLGERLLYAMKHEQQDYYVGIPCSVSHPKLSQLAKSIVGDKMGVVPAMTFHHNLSYFPQIIHELANRNCFFIMNDYQKLDLFEKLGVKIDEKNITRVPFVNSYLLYDELEEKQFPENAVVVLMCGMLAKILIPAWYQRNPKTTLLAFGSSFDDFIQRSNTKYTPYPKDLPLAGNIFPTKFFLFGWKRYCRECYNMQTTLD